MKNISAAAKALGRLGGLKGGKARAAKLTPEQRKEIAKKAAATRWAKAEIPILQPEAPDVRVEGQPSLTVLPKTDN